ncbi:MAG: secondary thiamine-phosphate synthase enzyme YjbQ [Candidatus Marinimicrobia bacterium]|nr:secondary thiamine-phosphate synthase enzyme YjbQ [Candidatus Neomarinimicrobiota bacterium]
MEITVKTDQKYQLVDLTDQVELVVSKSKVKEGLCLVFVPHSTAAIILTENESGLKNDWLKMLKKLVAGEKFEHDRIDNNADSHLLSGLLGQGRVMPIEKSRIVRGTWQNIFLVELDGPRTRRVIIKTIKSI